jgi:hypothetical protein
MHAGYLIHGLISRCDHVLLPLYVPVAGIKVASCLAGISFLDMYNITVRKHSDEFCCFPYNKYFKTRSAYCYVLDNINIFI